MKPTVKTEDIIQSVLTGKNDIKNPGEHFYSYVHRPNNVHILFLSHVL